MCVCVCPDDFVGQYKQHHPLRMRKDVNAQRMAAKRARDKAAREGSPMSDSTSAEDNPSDDHTMPAVDEPPTPKTPKVRKNTRYNDCFETLLFVSCVFTIEITLLFCQLKSVCSHRSKLVRKQARTQRMAGFNKRMQAEDEHHQAEQTDIEPDVKHHEISAKRSLVYAFVQRLTFVLGVCMHMFIHIFMYTLFMQNPPTPAGRIVEPTLQEVKFSDVFYYLPAFLPIYNHTHKPTPHRKRHGKKANTNDTVNPTPTKRCALIISTVNEEHYNVSVHVLCRNKTDVVAFPDMGGHFISVPVVWFNNAGGWKDTFAYPKRTFVVTMVEFSNTVTRRHEMCIMGAPSEYNFEIDQNAYTKFRKYWTDHGGRLVPCYTLKATTTGAYESLPTTPKQPNPRGMNQQSENMHVAHCVITNENYLSHTV